MENRREKIKLYIAYAIMAVFYLFIAFRVPYCHDDWDWGLDIGLAQWLEATINSRYVGNFFVVVMTRSEFVKTLVISVTLFSIPVLINALCGKKGGVLCYLISNILMLIIPKLMWQQTHGWVSGFANYVVSAMFTLLLILIMLKSAKSFRWQYWLLLPLPVIQALFLENLAVYSFLAFAAFTVIQIVKTKRFSAFNLCMTVASAIGCAIMFSSEIYGVLLDEGSVLGGIRILSFNLEADAGGIVTSLSERFFYGIFTPFFYDYPVIILALVLALVAGAAYNRKNMKAPSLAIVSLVCCFAFSVFVFFAKGNTELNLALAAMFFVTVSIAIALCFKQRGKMLFLWFSVFGVLAPLAVTTDVGPRLYYCAYIFVAVVCVCALPDLAKPIQKNIVSAVFAACLIGVMVFYAKIYVEIRTVTVLRAEAVEYAVSGGFDTVFIRKDPNKYWWGRNPQSAERVVYFKEFYGIPENVQVIFEE